MFGYSGGSEYKSDPTPALPLAGEGGRNSHDVSIWFKIILVMNFICSGICCILYAIADWVKILQQLNHHQTISAFLRREHIRE